CVHVLNSLNTSPSPTPSWDNKTPDITLPESSAGGARPGQAVELVNNRPDSSLSLV
uniref:Uncharacterized protein n=1 Tax=Chrysemys picta bellii TaxID=8478 RepID=A0A8C3FNU5_CHRPI